MGEIYAQLELINLYDPHKKMTVDAFLDTGSQLIGLPERMKETLGIKETKRVELAMTDGVFAKLRLGGLNY